MEIREYNSGVQVTGVQDFCLKHIFDCGQCFRFEEDEAGGYTGVVGQQVLRVVQTQEGILFENCTAAQFENVVAPYFDLDRDYGAIKSSLSEHDEVLRQAAHFGYGIRILRQDAWEMTISFIISQRNSIPKIKRVLALLCEAYGDKIPFRGKDYYTFPSAQILAVQSLSDLAFLKCGYRDRYLLDAAQKVASGEVDLKRLPSLPYDEAKAELLKIMGVGEKVAQCILLFGLQRFEAFPVDTWILQAMDRRYHLKSPQIAAFARERFAALSGFAQQYLFYCEREHGFPA